MESLANPRVLASAGNLRVRNKNTSIWTRFQALEYWFSIYSSRLGLAEVNVVNNISGAFGIFRRSVLTNVGGWDNGSAQDLDLTLRLKKFFGRYPGLSLAFASEALRFTDVPATLSQLLRQRLRWDGDLFFIYFRKHLATLRPSIIG